MTADASDGAGRLRPYFDSSDRQLNAAEVGAVRHSAAESPRLRPYQMTGGRTEPVDPTLAVEAQVVAAAPAAMGGYGLGFEHRDLVAAAKDPVSVAELGARLHLHLQVVRVHVADLAAAGYLHVMRPKPTTATDPVMIERVIRGLSAIS